MRVPRAHRFLFLTLPAGVLLGVATGLGVLSQVASAKCLAAPSFNVRVLSIEEVGGGTVDTAEDWRTVEQERWSPFEHAELYRVEDEGQYLSIEGVNARLLLKALPVEGTR